MTSSRDVDAVIVGAGANGGALSRARSNSWTSSAGKRQTSKTRPPGSRPPETGPASNSSEFMKIAGKGPFNTMAALFLQIAYGTLMSGVSKAQNGPDNSLPTTGAAVNMPTAVNYIPNSVASTTLAVLLFGMVCLIIQAVLLWRSRAESEEVLRNTTVTLVVTLGICALTIGYNQQQIAPITGLFGTIIGFLLGQRTSTSRRSDPIIERESQPKARSDADNRSNASKQEAERKEQPQKPDSEPR